MCLCVFVYMCIHIYRNGGGSWGAKFGNQIQCRDLPGKHPLYIRNFYIRYLSFVFFFFNTVNLTDEIILCLCNDFSHKLTETVQNV